MIKYILAIMAIAGLLFPSYAQERAITGKVTAAEDGKSLPGVNIQVEGTTLGAVTDAEGLYTVNVPEGKNVLVFSFVGFKPLSVDIGVRSVVDVQLTLDITQLNEILVVGYGTQLKQDITGNIAKVGGDQIKNLTVAGFDQALQGRAAGVFVEAGNGKLGQGIKVRVRGAASVSASNEPLYVIDGVVVTSGDLSSNGAATSTQVNINPNDIESIEILKDASAASIYGSRAANGVVLITTKRGKEGKTHFSIGYQKGFSSPTRKAKWLNGPEYYMAFNEAYDNSNKIIQRDFPGEDFGSFFYGIADLTYNDVLDFELGNWNRSSNVNWADLAYRDDAGLDQFDISASGGNEKTKFYTSLQWLDQKGILVQDRIQRFNGRINLDHQATDKIRLGLNMNISRMLNNRLTTDNEFTTPMQLLALPPIQPTHKNDGTLNEETVYFNGLIKKENSSYVTSVFRNISNLYAQWDIMPGLFFRSEAGADVLFQNEDVWDGKAVDSQTGNINGGGYSRWVNVQNYSTNNFLTYTKTLAAKHNIDVTAGMTYQESKAMQSSVTGQTFPSDAFRTLSSASVITAGNSGVTGYAFLSYFARLNYKLLDRYLLSLSGRSDGSSKFGANERYGFFPAASLGWVASQESFMKSIDFISFLKVRGSIGLTGNAPNGNFSGLGLYAANTYDILGGTAPVQLSNPNLKWETTLQTNFGIDLGVMNDRITAELDYYTKETSDLLLSSNVPATSGFMTRFMNIGKIENKGFEIVLNSRNIISPFSWTTSFNFAMNRNKILDLDGNVIEGGFINRAVEGQPIGVFFAQEYAGVNPDNGDALWYLNRDPQQGELTNNEVFKMGKFGDRYVTNVYTLAERKVVGNPNPKFIGGLTNTLSYKGIDLSFLFQFVQGNDVYNGGGRFERADFVYFDNHLVEDWKNAWRKPGDQTHVPQARLFFGNGDFVSSRYIQDASYVRLKTVSLGYNLPANLIKKAYLNSCRIYLSGQNLLTFTKYDLNDPEVNTDFLAGNIGQGNDFYAAPQIKTVSFGITAGF